MEYLFVISGVFSALFSLLILAKKKKSKEHWFLFVLFGLITINSIYVFNFYRSEAFYYVPFFSELNYAIPIMYGTLLWFYSKAMISLDFKMRKQDYFHFAPFICFLLILISPLILDVKLSESKHVGYPFIKLLISPFYLFAVLLLLKNYRQRLKDNFAFDHKMKLMWLSWITLGAIVLWVIAVIGFGYNQFLEGQKNLLYDYYVVSFLALYLFVLAFLAFRYTDIFHTIKSEDVHVKLRDDTSEKHKVENTEVEKEELNALLDIMKSQKPYLDPMLSINKLSEISKLPQYKISKMLNSSLEKNFYDFINGYRIEEVKQKLEAGEADNYSILGIASDCGFNSKASFNRVFKKFTGTTPSAYLKGLSNN